MSFTNEFKQSEDLIKGKQLAIKGITYRFEIDKRLLKIKEEGGYDDPGTWEVLQDNNGYYLNTRPAVHTEKLYILTGLPPESRLNDIILL